MSFDNWQTINHKRVNIRLDKRPLNTDVWSIAVDEDLHERVHKLAKKWKVTIGEAARMAIEWGLDHDG